MREGLQVDIDNFVVNRVSKGGYEFDKSKEGKELDQEIGELRSVIEEGLPDRMREIYEKMMDLIYLREFSVMEHIYKQGLMEYRSIGNYINETTDEI